MTVPMSGLLPRQPYVFSLSSAIFSTGEPDIRTFRDGMFRQVLAVDMSVVLADVTSHGTTGAPMLSLTLRSDHPVSMDTVQHAESQVASMLSLSDDFSPFYRAVEGDPVLAAPSSSAVSGRRSP